LSGRVYKLVMAAAAVAAWLAYAHIGMAAVIGYGWLVSVSSGKSRAVEKRLDRVVPAVSRTVTRVDQLSGNVTSTNGLANGTINGTSATGALNDGTIAGTSGGASAGTAHTHGAGSYAVNDGHHGHGGGSYAVNDGTHHHTLPTV
jgi:hypothetical protein